MTIEFIKSKFDNNNIKFNKHSINYFSNKKLLLLNQTLIKNIESSTSIAINMIRELLLNFKNGDYLEYYHFNDHTLTKIVESLSQDYLAFRLDWGIENGNPKLFEINAESCGFITECALIPRWINENSNLKSIDLNLYENYTKKLVKNLNNTDGKIFLGSLNYIYDIQNLNWIKLFLKKECFLDVEIINLKNTEYRENYYYLEHSPT